MHEMKLSFQKLAWALRFAHGIAVVSHILVIDKAQSLKINIFFYAGKVLPMVLINTENITQYLKFLQNSGKHLGTLNCLLF